VKAIAWTEEVLAYCVHSVNMAIRATDIGFSPKNERTVRPYCVRQCGSMSEKTCLYSQVISNGSREEIRFAPYVARAGT
jgi:hypothetical protein